MNYFQVRYDNATGSLNVTVVECQSLKKMDTFGKSDPFVRVYLLPGTHEVVKTEVIKKNLNPYFNENFKFTVNINLIETIMMDFQKLMILRFLRKMP